MRRRDFIALLGIAVTWPPATHAQQPGSVPMVGFLAATTPAIQKPWIDAFLGRLRELGRIDGQNLKIEYRWAEGRFNRSPELVAELLRLNVQAIVTHATPNVLAAKQATSSVPIVFAAAGDPVRNGIVASLSRPGGNVTGLALQQAELAGKRLQLLQEVVPGLRRVAMLVITGNPNIVVEAEDVQAAADALGLQLTIHHISRVEDIAPALEALSGRAEAVYMPTDPLLSTNRFRVTSAVAALRLPTIYSVRDFVHAGGLLSYGPNFPDLFRRAADLLDKILAGAKPGDLPVEQPRKFDIVVNLKTATALGVTIPATILTSADEVIE